MKYGKDFFIRYDLACGTKEEMSLYEKHLIEHYRATSRNDFYNLREGGFNGKHSVQTKNKISKSITEKWQDAEYRNKSMSSILLRDKTAFINSAKRDKSHKNNPMFGKSHTNEAKQKMSNARIGIKLKLNEEQRNKLRENIMKNEKLMGKKTNKQKAKNRWAALSKEFSKEPIVSHDMNMMHEYYRA